MDITRVTSATPLQNELLAALSPEVQQRLYPLLELYPLPPGKILYESGDTLHHAYFPTDAIISLQYDTEDGASAGFSIVGQDGFIGVALLLGGKSIPWRKVVQSQGLSFRLPEKALMDEFNRHGELHRVLLHYSQTLITQIAQTAVCNRHHTLKQQLCRWLLTSLDRLPDNHMEMTQERIAHSMGVRREGVTEAARELQTLDLITYRRGHIMVLSRQGLERLCCECYQVVKHETNRLMNNKPKPREPVHY